MAATKNSATQTRSEHAKKSRNAKAAPTQTAPAEAPSQTELVPTPSADTPAVPVLEPPPSIPATPAEEPTTPQTEAAAIPPPEAKKLSALDAALKVLAETGQAMSCPELIAAMAAKGYWSSPKGKTPASTLYASLLRELQSQGENARIRKAERGKFILRGVA
jgi:hypothetical protein